MRGLAIRTVVRRRCTRVVSFGLACALVASAAACSSSSDEDGARGELKPIDRAALQATFDATTKSLLVPGAFALVRTPSGTVTLTHGTTRVGEQSAPNTRDAFRIGSVTKTMTAAVVLQLVEEGKVALDDPVGRYLPGVPDGGSITVAELLNMRSGLHNYLDTRGFADAFRTDPTKVWAPQDLLALAYAEPSSFAPGTAFEYSNTNTILAGLLAEELDGRPLAASFSARLFDPLGMTRTELPDATTTDLPQPAAHGYQYGPLQVSDKALTPTQQAAAEDGSLKLNDVTVQSPSWSWAAGGVVSTPENLMTWIRALVRGKVLGPAMQQEWIDSVQLQDPAVPKQLYGYGISQIRFGSIRLTYHEGQLPGFNTMAVDDPTNNVSLVIWTNRAVDQERDIALSVLVALVDHIYRTPADTPPV